MNIFNTSVLILSLTSLASCWADAENFSYKECIVAVESPISQNGFGSVGAEWISTHMIQDNINEGKGIRTLPNLIRVTDNGFYFYFHETCDKKMEWSEYYISNFIAHKGVKYSYDIKSLTPKDVDILGIQEILKY